MHVATFLISLLATGALANLNLDRDRDPDHDPDHDSEHDSGHENGQRRICPGLDTQDKGCIRYTRGFDVTGVTTEVDLTFPEIKDECDCIQACLDRIETCANYVWKFSTPESVRSGHRTCTLYSNFNLPQNVTLAFNVDDSVNIEPLDDDNNPQRGSLVPQAFKDVNLNTTADNEAVSGPVWALSNGDIQC
ncbi:hypothetical protein ASPVEDRAFT_47084 [Aspergillus versicolor CBS 583.65]|uniref:Apple domain-containing protein n=1 Tax=Aspergillus versicolor CBS 583.65 TaxID=1036611 RepID=A0A1L9Q289_ASPVE|nr:uncharacterized protein ASPVEDRAFT_47084 [Aspergillus versicolor CBS 583.65]OJJ07897.1 hypothetical protein ASPVEDRAFT_47084 [Aspergillus versicolor CBS 583.65]